MQNGWDQAEPILAHTCADLGPVLIAKIRLQRIVYEVRFCVCLFLFDPDIKGRLNILFVSKISQMFVLLFSSWSSKVKFNLLNIIKVIKVIAKQQVYAHGFLPGYGRYGAF